MGRSQPAHTTIFLAMAALPAAGGYGRSTMVKPWAGAAPGAGRAAAATTRRVEYRGTGAPTGEAREEESRPGGASGNA